MSYLETSPPGNGNKYFTISVACPYGVRDPYRSAILFQVRAGDSPRYYSYADDDNAWHVLLKMEAFYDGDHDQ